MVRMNYIAGGFLALWLCVGMPFHVAFDHTELAHHLLGVIGGEHDDESRHHTGHASDPSRTEIHCVCEQGPVHEHGSPHAHSIEAVTVPSPNREDVQVQASDVVASLVSDCETFVVASTHWDVIVPASRSIESPAPPRAPPLA